MGFPFKRRSRFPSGKRLTQAGVLLFLVAIGFYLVFLAPLVEYSLNRSLRQIGFQSASVDVTNISLRHLHLSRVKLDAAGAFQVASLDADWRLNRLLLQRRLKEVTLTGMRWQIDTSNDKPALAPFHNLLDGASTAGEGVTRTGPWRLPLSRLEIKASTILLQLPQKRVPIPFEATVSCRKPTAIQATLTARLGNRAYRLNLNLESSRDALSASFEAFREALLPAYATAQNNQDTPPLLKGKMDWDFAQSLMRLHLAGGTRKPLKFDWGETSVSLQRGDFTAGMTLGPQGQFQELNGTIALSDLHYNNFDLEELTIDIDRHSEKIRVIANAAGRSWRLRRLRLDLPNRPERWLGGQIRAPLKVELLPTSKNTGTNDMLQAFNLQAKGLTPIELESDLIYRPQSRSEPNTAAATSGFGLVEIRDARLSGDAEWVRTGKSAPQLNACTWQLSAAGHIDADGIDLRLLPDSGLTVQNIVSPHVQSAGSSTSSSAEPPAFMARLADTARISATLAGKGTPDWQLSLPKVAISLAARNLDTETFPFKQASAEARLSFDLTHSPQATRYSGRLETSEPLKLAGDTFSTEVSGLRIDVKETVTPARAPTLPAQLSIHIAEWRASPYKAALRNCKLHWTSPDFESPDHSGRNDASPQNFLQVGNLQYGEHTLPGFRLKLKQSKADGLRWTGSWPLTETAEISLDGDASLSSSGLQAKATATASRFQVERGDRLASLVAEIANIELTGGLEGSATLSVSPGELQSSGSITASNLAVSDRDDSYTISGINTTVHLDSLSPLTTERSQTLRWKNATLGQFELGNGHIAFKLDGLETLFVHHAGWRISDSTRFWLQSFETNPFKPSVDTQIFCEHLDLNQWLSLATKGHAKGRGMLNGRIRFHFQSHPEPELTLQDGFLYASGEGHIQVTNTKLAKKVLQNQSSLATSKNGRQYNQIIQQRILQSIQHFEYSTLTFDLVPTEDGLTMTVRTKGKGHDVPQGLDLTLNFHGVDKLISLAVGLKLGRKQ